MSLRLQVLDGSTVDRLPVLQGTYLIGRAEDCDLRLSGPTVSRYHCEITYTGHATIVRDLGSKNGTYVNGKRVFGPRVLTVGDQIQVGPLKMAAEELPDLVGSKRPPVQSVHEAAARLSDSTIAEHDVLSWLAEQPKRQS